MGRPQRRFTQELTVTPEHLENIIATRRSSLLIDAARPIDRDIIERLITAAQWAPNHKRVWPLRASVIQGESRHALGNAIADVMEHNNEEAFKVTKTRTKYTRSPVTLVVAAAEGASASETEENKYAVAAGIQNLLLLAHSFGLSALWGSPSKGTNAAVTRFCGLDDNDHVMGLIYLGWPTQTVATPERPTPVVTWLD
jgi:nitroreductase